MAHIPFANLAIDMNALAIATNVIPRKGKKNNLVKKSVETIIGTSLLRSSAANVALLG